MALTIGAILYLTYGVIFLSLSFTDYASNTAFIVVAVIFSLLYFSFGYAALKVRTNSFSKKQTFVIVTGIFWGAVTGIGGWEAGLVLSPPLLSSLYGIKDIWWKPYSG
ncbi:MAG: hypothetical protein OEY06_11590 [Gammaproteobacteria bacterium]|nr:hypothetical protein [Gammaproteobacteria bacterium]